MVRYVIKFARVLGMDKIATRRAWSVLMVPLQSVTVQDSYYTPVSVNFAPQELALASLFVAQAFLDQQLGKMVDVDAVKGVCKRFHCVDVNVMSMSWVGVDWGRCGEGYKCALWEFGG
jgi:hypothetical protein